MNSEITPNTQETNVTDIVGAILNKKREGILVICVVLLLGIGLNFLLPKKFEAKELLHLALVNGNPIETVATLNTIFDTNTAIKEIAGELNLSPSVIHKSFLIEGAAGGSFIRIRGRSDTPDMAVRVAKAISDKIIKREEGLYEPARYTLEKGIDTLLGNKQKTAEDIKHLEKVTQRLDSEVKFYQAEVAKRADVQSEAQGRIVESYIKLLSDARSQQDTSTQGIANLKQNLVAMEEEEQRQKFTLAYSFTPPTVESPATLPANQISPNLIQNAIYSFVLGVFLAIAWILVRTYHIQSRRK